MAKTVELDHPLEIAGDVHIILEMNSKLLTPGIYCLAGKLLSIHSETLNKLLMRELVSFHGVTENNGGDLYAGIYNNLTVNGGEIYAYGGTGVKSSNIPDADAILADQILMDPIPDFVISIASLTDEKTEAYPTRTVLTNLGLF